MVSDTTWPESTCISINDRHLEIRRKLHHGKDLPIDITQFIVPTSADPATINCIKVSIIKWIGNEQKSPFFLAVEIIEVLQHDQILHMCKEEHIPAEQTLHAMKKTFAPSDKDDDVIINISDLSIDLVDPFTKRIFDIPVRGSTCLHRECFDLETFLLTRESKVKWLDQPCIPDVWKCPICGKDARPGSLRIDDFLASVRGELKEKDMLHVKAIQVSHDGCWRPMEVPKVSNSNKSDENSHASEGYGGYNGKRRRIEVIDLGDD
ncbi:hypothetical protein DL95DRAFT_136866 [Leptodontidium sp. 2 PMI_412]|nr:hypothetical protein DL95DRAFT_136866 [Leptodontidium sp. 2 PMI_412]